MPATLEHPAAALARLLVDRPDLTIEEARRELGLPGPLTASDLVKVDFYGDTLEAVQRDGKVWVSLRRCCENLGLAMQSQLEKLKAKAWASVTEIVMDSPDNSQRKVACIDLETLPGWLFSVDARKVAEHLREKLARYHPEAKYGVLLAEMGEDVPSVRIPIAHSSDSRPSSS